MAIHIPMPQQPIGDFFQLCVAHEGCDGVCYKIVALRVRELLSFTVRDRCQGPNGLLKHSLSVNNSIVCPVLQTFLQLANFIPCGWAKNERRQDRRTTRELCLHRYALLGYR